MGWAYKPDALVGPSAFTAPVSRPSPAFLYLAFFATGMATVLTGAVLALGGPGSGLADHDIGRMLAVQFSGQLTGAFFVGRALHARLVLGAGVTCLGGAGLALFSNLPLLLLFAYGVGLGLSMAAINTLAGLESPLGLRSRRLELLNVCWPLGAACCPWIVVRLASSMPLHTLRVAAFLAIACLFLMIAGGTILRGTSVLDGPSESAGNASASHLAALSLLALLAVGVESGLANWLPTFQARYLGPDVRLIPLASIFWASVLGSRLCAARWMKGPAQRSFIPVAAIVTALSAIGLVLFHAAILLALCAMAAACSIGPVYPVLLDEVVQLRRRGVVFLCAAAGSALFPWLIGRCSSGTQSLRAAFLLPAAGSLLLLALYRSAVAGRQHDSS